MRFVIRLLFLSSVLLPTSVMAQWQSDYIAIEVVGEGAPVFLIPGFLSDQRVWDDTAQRLSEHYQVHRVSIKGFGSTPAATSPSLHAVKQALIDYINTQDMDAPVVIGHSLGGFMGYWLAVSEHVELSGIIAVDGLPFIGPVFSRDPTISADTLAPQANMMRQYYGGLDAEGMKRTTMRGLTVQASSEQHQALILKMAEISDPTTAGDAMYTLMTTDLRGPIQSVQIPVLLLGASGGFADKVSQDMAKQAYLAQFGKLTGVQVKMNTQSRHFIMFDQPKWLHTEILVFLQEVL